LGILPENRKISGAIIMTRKEEVPPEVSGFRLRPRPEAQGRAVLTPEAASMKKFARGSVALLLADFARRERRHPEMGPQTSPRKDKSTAHRATHSPTTARKRGTQGEGARDNLALNQIVQSDAFGSPLFKMKNCKNFLH